MPIFHILIFCFSSFGRLAAITNNPFYQNELWFLVDRKQKPKKGVEELFTFSFFAFF